MHGGQVTPPFTGARGPHLLRGLRVARVVRGIVITEAVERRLDLREVRRRQADRRELVVVGLNR
jgi:hypothetical protein